MRKREIIEILKDEKFVSLESIAEKLSVSTRTIRNDIRNLNQESNSFCINYSQLEGYFLVVKSGHEFERLVSEWANERFEDKSQRIDSIMIYLLINNRFVTNQELSTNFEISISQVKKDSKLISERLVPSNLSLERKAHYGIKINADIFDRLAYINQYFKENPRKLKKYGIDTHISEISLCAREICQKFNIRSEGEAFETIQRLLKILIHFDISKTNEDEELVFQDLNALESILMKYEATRNIVDYAGQIYQFILDTQSRCLLTQNKLKAFLKALFAEVDMEFKTKFLDDSEFMKLIQLHISVMIESKQAGNIKKNFLIKTMERDFPGIMTAAIFVVQRIENEFGIEISQEEIGYVTSHMAVSYERQSEAKNNQYYKIALVCSSGGGIAQLMAFKFTKIFPLSTIQNFTVFDEKKILEFDPDLIFTIRPLAFEARCPVILIKEVLDEIDYLYIQNNLDLLTEFGDIDESNQKFIDMISPDFFSIQNSEDYEELLLKISSNLENELGYAGYSESILERERYVATIYDNGIAIPHPMQMQACENVISVTLLPVPIKFHQKKVRIIFMLALKPGQLELHQYISKKLYGLMQHKTKVKELSKCQNYEAFIQLLGTYL
jgi:probable transcription antiterminator